jgi:concentrative nucleoside transporter, CNT family
MERLFSFLGLFGFVALAWALSTNRRAVNWHTVGWGLALQLGIASAILLPDFGQTLFAGVDSGVRGLLAFSEAGADFLFQTIEPHQIATASADGFQNQVYIGRISPPLKTIAFWVLPSVIFFSALMALLYHYGLMQRLVTAFAKVMQKTMRVSGAESLSAAANIFVGQTEAPLVIRPFVGKMTDSELNAVMVGGFATVAGGVMAIYVGFLSDVPGIAGHLVTASIISAPAALAIAKVMVPETEVPVTSGEVELSYEKLDINGIDAISRGTLEGLRLALNIGAMLIVFVAIIAMVNGILGMLGGLVGWELSLQGLCGYLFFPLALLMGIPWEEAMTVGTLLGEKIILTELIAFTHLREIQMGAEALSERSAIISSYALCGFANFASIGIQIGGIGGIAPERRSDLARLGFRAMVGGTIAAMMTGAVAGVLL